MSDVSIEWLEAIVAGQLERQRSANELTKQIVIRAYERIAISEALLKFKVPRVWHPEPPKH